MVSFTLPDGPLVDDDLTNIMIGTWEAHSLSITMPTHGSSDTTKFLSITPENWREVIGLEPVKTYFLANGRYYAEYYDLNGNLMKRPQGFWSVSGGTLMYEEKEPAPVNAVDEARDAKVSFVTGNGVVGFCP